MLSTQYRLKLENICNRIASSQEVTLEEMVWANKLGRVNTTANTMLRQARRRAQNPEMTEDSMDGFLNALDLGDLDPSNHLTGFNSIDEIVDWFRRDDTDDEDRRKRD